jgi:hypothetical protein
VVVPPNFWVADPDPVEREPAFEELGVDVWVDAGGV